MTSPVEPVHPTEEQLRQYLDDALSDESAAEVKAHLDDCTACAARLEALSAEFRTVSVIMKDVGEPSTATSPPPSMTDIPRQVGPYRLLDKLGEGGMGQVFRAEQSEPIQRTVALKVIKLGMDTASVIARFEAERQALAMMNHPNVARVLNAGATAEGRPYFVMELVKGEPITAYCDRHRLTTRERLELFMPVCHAVQHAHQKGIIHRDLKPCHRRVLASALTATWLP